MWFTSFYLHTVNVFLTAEYVNVCLSVLEHNSLKGSLLLINDFSSFLLTCDQRTVSYTSLQRRNVFSLPVPPPPESRNKEIHIQENPFFLLYTF